MWGLVAVSCDLKPQLKFMNRLAVIMEYILHPQGGDAMSSSSLEVLLPVGAI